MALVKMRNKKKVEIKKHFDMFKIPYNEHPFIELKCNTDNFDSHVI